MKKRSRIILGIVSITALLGLVGCGQNKTEESSQSSNDPSNEISLTVWGYDQNREFKALVEGFEKSYDAKVKILDFDPGSYKDKVTTMLASGDQTDVLTIKDVGSYVNYANKNQLVDLTEYADGLDKDLLENYNGTLEGYRTDEGKIFALPFRKDVYVLFYNKRLFDEAGVEYPKDLNWNEYKELAGKLTSGENEAEKVYGTFHHKWFPIIQATAANQTGNDLLSGKYNFLKEYYKTFIDIQEAGHAMDYATIKTTNTTFSSVFETEKTAMMYMGSFYVSNVLDAIENGETKVDWALAPIPQREDAKEVISYGTPTGMSINKNAKNPDLARKFVEFCSGKEGAEILASIGMTSAYSNSDILDKLFSVEGMPQDEISRKALSPDVNGYEYAAKNNAAEISKALGEEHDLLMVGDVTIDDGIAELEKRVENIQ